MAGKGKLSLADVKRAVKDSGRSYIADVDSDHNGATGVWWTESHVAVKLSGQRYDSPILKLLASLDIDPTTPTAIDSDLRLDPNGTVPNIGAVIPHKKYHGPVVDVRRCGTDRLIRESSQYGAVLMFGDGPTCYVQARYVDLAEQSAKVTEWHVATPLKPIVGYDVDGNTVAVVMPIRMED